ncbi:unnamed protein product [Staurois parvus]|uniref:Uncharacterized protein n=1 Tax=Staurois parvus TaxID=386267 RepID=A0ABN9FJK3_9NEOB|nr:unnamed protein product [Staurois parvus]
MWEGPSRPNPLQAACRKLQEGGGDKTSPPAQGEGAAVSGLYYRRGVETRPVTLYKEREQQ